MKKQEYDNKSYNYYKINRFNHKNNNEKKKRSINIILN